MITDSKPSIEVLPMLQGSDIRHDGEDWSGCTNAAVRRKLQNRLNQRASRRRRNGVGSGSQSPAYEIVQKKVRRSVKAAASTENELPECRKGVVEIVQLKSADVSASSSSLETVVPSKVPSVTSGTCMDLFGCRSMVSSPNFRTFVTTNHIYPLSADHAALTLLHFNLVRALSQNILHLGLDLEIMEQDIPSPWQPQSPSPVSTPHLTNLPPALHPSHLQRSIPHHPHIDVLPFRKYKDNLILAGETIDDEELCHDMIYGVDTGRSKDLRFCSQSDLGGRTGLIVWCDPSLQASWEVEEAFLRKWKQLFVGCHDVLENTNYWREKRGESRLAMQL